jgi:ribosomal-protein-alanine N-acetyltransferase
MSVDFKLRPWSINDLPSLVKYANNFNRSNNLTDKFPHPYSEEDGKRFIAMATAGNPIHIFCIEINGEAAGGIGIHPQDDVHRKNAELGYWLAEPYWGHGIITRAIPMAIDFAFERLILPAFLPVRTEGIKLRNACWKNAVLCSKGNSKRRFLRMVNMRMN